MGTKRNGVKVNKKKTKDLPKPLQEIHLADQFVQAGEVKNALALLQTTEEWSRFKSCDHIDGPVIDVIKKNQVTGFWLCGISLIPTNQQEETLAEALDRLRREQLWKMSWLQLAAVWAWQAELFPEVTIIAPGTSRGKRLVYFEPLTHHPYLQIGMVQTDASENCYLASHSGLKLEYNKVVEV